MKGSMNGITAMVAQMQNARPIISTDQRRSAYDRFMALEKLAAGVSIKDVAREFGVKICTIQRWSWAARRAQQ